MGLEQHTVIDAIRATAARCPQTVALRTAFSTMPYGELVARVDGLAARLLGCGVGPETRVGIHLRRSPEMIVAMLAILGAGAAYVPLDPDYPLARLRYIVEDSQVALVLGEKDTTDILGRPSVDRLDPSEWPHDPPSEPLPTPNSTDPAYVIYTSGSTGTPKGVVIEHAAMTNYLAWCLQALPATGGGVPLFASVSFDHAVTCIYPPLMVGEPLTLLPSIQGGRTLAQGLLTECRYSFVKITPSHLRLLDLDQRAKLGRSADLVMLGGERVSSELVTQLRRDAPELAVMNHYGPTEATVGCCIYLVPKEAPTGTLPIGQPISGIDVTVRDPNGAICRSNEPGELYIGGVGLAREYWRRPDLTDTAFVILDGLDGIPKRWYRSGDLVTQRADGILEYLGRVDDQIKILGHRVEPAEIETVIRQHPGVVDAAIVSDDRPGGVELVAAVVVKNMELTEVLLDQHVQAHLPAAMVPSQFIILDQLPVTANGKLDRDAFLLKAKVVHSNAFERSGSLDGDDDIETQLVAKWQEVFGVKAIGLDADFFELGGDSLASVEIVRWASRAFKVDLELPALFEHPTVRELADVIRSFQA
jgi:amino acid adenylation domain-containing protein